MASVASHNDFQQPTITVTTDDVSVPSPPVSPLSYDNVVSGDVSAATAPSRRATQISFSPDPASQPVEPRRQLKDPVYLLLFIAHIVAMVVVGAETASSPKRGWFASSGARHALQNKLDVAAILGALAGMGWTFVVFSSMRPKILYLSQLVAGVLLGIHSLILFVKGFWGLGLVVAILVAGDTAWMLHARPRVRFVEVLLEMITQVLRRRQRLVYIALGASVVQTVYLIMWTHMFTNVLATTTSSFRDVVYITIMLVSLRWTCGVIKHVVTICVSGTFAVWLNASASSTQTTFTYDLDEDLGIEFGVDDTGPALEDAAHDTAHAQVTDADDVRLVAGPGRSGTPVRAPRGQSPTPFIRYADHTPLDFLLQALTLNLGSVCAGAMVGLFSPVLWAMHRASRRCERARTRRIHRMATSFSAVIDAVLRRSHKYTYTQVATKGKSWFLSAHDTWTSFMTRGVEGVVYDDCSDRLLLFGCYIGGGLLALVLGTTLAAGNQHWLAITLVVFWFGFVGVGLPLTVMEASVSSLFVCFAEAPQSVSTCHPIVYHRFVRISELRHFRRSHGDHADDDV